MGRIPCRCSRHSSLASLHRRAHEKAGSQDDDGPGRGRNNRGVVAHQPRAGDQYQEDRPGVLRTISTHAIALEHKVVEAEHETEEKCWECYQ